MKHSLFALALVSFAGSAAFADDNNVVLSYGSFEKSGVTTEGLKYDFEGSMGAFGYEGYAFDGDTNDVNANAAGLKANWTGLNLGGIAVGPAVSYDKASLGGVSADEFAVGAAMKTSFGAANLKGDALFSTDDKSDWAASLQAEMGVGANTTLLTEYGYTDYDIESHDLELGARYNVSNAAFVEGRVIAERSGGNTGTGASFGLGFRF